MNKNTVVKKCILFITLSSCFSSIQAQTTYNVGLSTQSFWAGSTHSCRSSESGFGIVSRTNSNSSICIIKTDSLGNFLWAKQLDYQGAINNENIIPTTDSGFILTNTVSDTLLGSLLVLQKLSAVGILEWSEYFTSPLGNLTASGLVPCNDSGFAIAGSGCGGDNYVIRFDKDCNIIWGYEYPVFGSIASVPLSIVTRSNGNFIVTGYVVISSVRKVSLFEIDTSGNLLWSHLYNDGEPYWSWSISETAAHEITISGTTGCSSAPGYPSFILKVDSMGNFQWMNQYTCNTPICISDHVSLSTGSIVAVGSICYPTSSNAEYLSFGVDYNGTATTGYSDGNSSFNHQGGDWTHNVFSADGESVFTVSEGGDNVVIHRFDSWLNGFCDSDAVLINTTPMAPTIDNPVHTISAFNPASNSYTVTVYDVDFVSSLFCASITTDETERATLVQPQLYCEPGAITIDPGQGGIFTVEIYDLTGKLISYGENIATKTQITGINPGVYVVRLTSSSQLLTLKLIVPYS